MKYLEKKIGLVVALFILTAFMSGCGPPQDTHDYNADIAQVTNDQTINPHDKAKLIADLQSKLADQNTARYLAQQQQEQWIPSEIIGGICFVVLIGALIARGVQSSSRSASRAKGGSGAYGKSGANKPGANKSGTKGTSNATPVKSGSPGKTSPALAPASRGASWELPTAPANVPEVGQEAVDAIPEEQRGVSFFTSRPLSLDHLVEITIGMGERVVTVWATKEEAEAAKSGRMPRVRALSMDGETRPWYAWHAYDPFRDYWSAESSDWVWRGGVIVASWLPLDRVDPSLVGYLTPLPDEGSIGDAFSEDVSEPGVRRLRKALMTLDAQDKPSFEPQKMHASAHSAARNGSEPQSSPKKTGLRHLWIYQVRHQPKKAGRAALQSLD